MPHASPHLIARYLASLNGRSERDILEALGHKTGAVAQVATRWSNLEKTARSLFGDLALFEGVTGRVEQPVPLPRKQNLAGQRGPVVLPSIPEGELNFRYGAPQVADNAARGLGKHGPYDEDQGPGSAVPPAVVRGRAPALR